MAKLLAAVFRAGGAWLKKGRRRRGEAASPSPQLNPSRTPLERLLLGDDA
jgi:hypothetical protein